MSQYRYMYNDNAKNNDRVNKEIRRIEVVPFAVTISPPVRGSNDVKQCKIDMWVMRYIHRYSSRYIIIPELSYDMRLHYHGIVHGTRYHMLRYVLPHLRKKIGFVKATVITDPLGYLRYLQYCKKDWHQNREIFDGYLTPYTRKKWIRQLRRVNNKARILKIYKRAQRLYNRAKQLHKNTE